MSTIAELLRYRDRLGAISDSPALDVELLLCHCLDRARSYLRAWPEAEVDAQQVQRFLHLLQRRVEGEPIAYLTGECGFWSLHLSVSAATLIPRPETELLVEETLRVAGDRTQLSVLDLGTGSGAIALALATERPAWRIVACDRSIDAMRVAESNRHHLGLQQVAIVQSDWYSALGAARFDLIVSNPPYIDAGDPHLQRGDVRYEPRSALVADRQGYAAIEDIIEGATRYLLDGGWLLFEHGYNQGQGSRERLSAAGFADVFTTRDLAGHERVSGGRHVRPAAGRVTTEP